MLFNLTTKHTVFSLPLFIEDWMCAGAEFVQVAESAGNRCWQASDGHSIHFAGGKLNSRMLELAPRFGVRWWRPDWEQRVVTNDE